MVRIVQDETRTPLRVEIHDETAGEECHHGGETRSEESKEGEKEAQGETDEEINYEREVEQIAFTQQD